MAVAFACQTAMATDAKDDLTRVAMTLQQNCLSVRPEALRSAMGEG
jgi:hypothetical protein